MSKSEAEHVTQIAGDTSQKRGVKGCFVADISQSPKYTVRGGAFCPRPMTSTVLMSSAKDGHLRFVLPEELRLAHGFPEFDYIDEYNAAMVVNEKKLSGPQRLKAIGNGMHVSLRGAWYSFCFSHLLKRSLNHGFPPH